MGTLTGSTPSLPDHCAHKLPTSCRLTATALCCACQDKRPHSSSYSVYVDGVGLVNRGTRWQRYCYFCREFWTNRLAATEPRLEAGETRIPQEPDQREFLERWFEFHRGYRIVKSSTGIEEERVEVRCEKPWRDVDPGMLPVLDDVEQRAAIRTRPAAVAAQETEHMSLDDTLEKLLLEADDNAAGTDGERMAEVQVQSRQNESARERSRAGLNLEPDLAALQQALDHLRSTEDRLAAAESRKERALQELEVAESVLRGTQSERRQAQRAHRVLQAHVRQLQSQANAGQRAAQRHTRVFGTREEVEQQGADYVSPLTTIFTRADEWYRVAEEVRAEERASVVTTERYQNLMRSIHHNSWSFGTVPTTGVDTAAQIGEVGRTLDDAVDKRPPPMSDDEMTVKLACKVCLQQKADTAMLPCGHLVMCACCADIVVPTAKQDRTRPIGRFNCPLCRKHVKRRVIVFHA